MSKLGWGEIRNNAIKFARNWKDVSREDAEAQTFWNEFFKVFGLERRTVASFEEPVKNLKGSYGAIDLFWPGRLLAEHKSRGKALDKAKTQAITYIHDLQREDRGDEVPRYIIVSDFARIVLHDLEPDDQGELFKGADHATIEIPLDELHKHVRHFAFILGQQTHRFKEEDPANIEAAELMAELHDAMEEGGYPAHDLERLLVRILFCLFADDTGIFEPRQFEFFIENYAKKKDGSDLGQHLSALFEILDTPVEKRQKSIDEDLKAFPYINGDLFDGHLPLAGFNRTMRDKLVACTRFNWSRISPAIFGSLFQGIMDDKERRQIGAHYTSERDILKVIRPLFLDDLHAEFEQIKNDRSVRRKSRLEEFQKKLGKLNLLDPACGCGNFLVISYRELRRLELEALKLLHADKMEAKELDLGEVAKLSKVDVNQFYGIEIGEWAARIAETALWLTDHQMNVELSLAFGNTFQRIPLKASPHIKCANALRFDWSELLPPKDCSFVLGNPPFVGAKEKDNSQRADLDTVWFDVDGHGVLDYVTAWYRKTVDYFDGLARYAAFVSTNSITLGEQVSVFWRYMLSRGVKISFAHRTFQWQGGTKGRAHVHCVIIGFSQAEKFPKRLFEYEDVKADPIERTVAHINPYLVEAPDTTVTSRTHPLKSSTPAMMKGSEATDDGHLIFDDDTKNALVNSDSRCEEFIRRYVGGNEYMNEITRWCFWLADTPTLAFREIPEIRSRLRRVRDFRSASRKKRTRELANTPYLFGENRQPKAKYLLIPKVSSERRDYVPIGYVSREIIANGSALIIPDATVFHFGILISSMHMAWMRQVCGRMESRYQYSVSIVYNNFPWPESGAATQKKKVEDCAQAVLDTRQPHLERGSTLADLYDPLTMPKDLLDAHHALDRAVDKCYRGEKFNSERERVEFLFRLYEQITAPLAPTTESKKKRAPRKAKDN